MQPPLLVTGSLFRAELAAKGIVLPDEEEEMEVEQLPRVLTPRQMLSKEELVKELEESREKLRAAKEEKRLHQEHLEKLEKEAAEAAEKLEEAVEELRGVEAAHKSIISELRTLK